MDVCFKRRDNTPQWISLNAGAFGYHKIVCFMNDISGKKKEEHSKFVNSEKNKDKIKQKLNNFQQEIQQIALRINKV